MTGSYVVDVDAIDAVIFDLDGVITKTASVHQAAWAELFNEYLQDRAERTGEPFQPFEAADYLGYVDGKPRYDGVAAFWSHATSTCPGGHPRILPKRRPCRVSGIGRTGTSSGIWRRMASSRMTRPWRSSRSCSVRAWRLR